MTSSASSCTHLSWTSFVLDLKFVIVFVIVVIVGVVIVIAIIVGVVIVEVVVASVVLLGVVVFIGGALVIVGIVRIISS